MNNKSGCLSAAVVIVIVAIACIGGCFGFFNKHIMGNKQIIDFKQTFNTAYIEIPGKEPVKVRVSKWNDYDKSDSIQVVTEDSKVYYTHIKNVVLTNE